MAPSQPQELTWPHDAGAHISVKGHGQWVLTANSHFPWVRMTDGQTSSWKMLSKHGRITYLQHRPQTKHTVDNNDFVLYPDEPIWPHAEGMHVLVQDHGEWVLTDDFVQPWTNINDGRIASWNRLCLYGKIAFLNEKPANTS